MAVKHIFMAKLNNTNREIKNKTKNHRRYAAKRFKENHKKRSLSISASQATITKAAVKPNKVGRD
jgi:3-oxoacyl-[acyl-carrier-protein] synthase III